MLALRETGLAYCDVNKMDSAAAVINTRSVSMYRELLKRRWVTCTDSAA